MVSFGILPKLMFCLSFLLSIFACFFNKISNKKRQTNRKKTFSVIKYYLESRFNALSVFLTRIPKTIFFSETRMH